MTHPSDAGTPYLLLSYSTPNRERVVPLADRVTAAGVRVRVDRCDLVGGSRRDTSIVRAITDCTVFVLVSSPAAVHSRNVQQQLHLAWEEQGPVLPLLLEPVRFPDRWCRTDAPATDQLHRA